MRPIESLSLSYEKIVNNIDAGKFAPIYLLHGEEGYFIDDISRRIEARALSEAEKAFNQIVLYGKDVDFKDIVDNARQFPMMAERRVVIVNEAQSMRSLKELDSYALSPSPQTILVLNHKHKKIDGRLSLVKNIKKTGVVFESKKLYDNQVAPWIKSYLKTKKIAIEPQAAMILTEFLGTDLSKITNELEKLILNLEGNRSISTDDVVDQVGISKEFNVFELQKAISFLDTEKAFLIANYFAANEKSNPLVFILSSLYSYLIKVYIAAFHKTASDAELQRMLGLPSPFFVKEYRAASKNYSSGKILEAFSFLRSADLHSKGIDTRNNEMEPILRTFLIQMFY